MVPRERKRNAPSTGVPTFVKRVECALHMAHRLSDAALRDVPTLSFREDFVGDMVQ